MFQDHDAFYDPSIVHIQRVTVWRVPNGLGTGDDGDDINIVLTIHSSDELPLDKARRVTVKEVSGLYKTDITISLAELSHIVGKYAADPNDKTKLYLDSLVVAAIYAEDTRSMPPKNTLAQHNRVMQQDPFNIHIYRAINPRKNERHPKKETPPPKPKITNRPKLG